MEKLIKKFAELTAQEVYDVLKLRQDVFIIEQNCIYSDIDGSDSEAIHILLYEKDNLAAYSRLFAPGIKFKQASAIGRIIVAPAFRGSKFGRLLIEESISLCKELYPNTEIRIEAQAKLESYYKKYGFKSVSDVYEVDAIPHIQMVIIPG
tara:strand:- start:18395 stop:18844 length:450 start_codon:yes stop_codon:yes gene_type:complete